MLRLETVGNEHDPTEPVDALRAIHEADKEGRHVTGLLYYNPDKKTATETLGLSETPLMALPDSELRPSKDSLEQLNTSFRTN